MKYILTFYSQEPVMVPASYNKILQAALSVSYTHLEGISDRGQYFLRRRILLAKISCCGGGHFDI